MPRADPVTIAAFPSSTPTWVFSLFSLEFAGGDDDVACGDVSGHVSLGAVLASALPPVEQHHLLQAAVHRGRVWTYRELAGHASALAGRLRSLGVEPGDRVGVCTERSLPMFA